GRRGRRAAGPNRWIAAEGSLADRSGTAARAVVEPSRPPALTSSPADRPPSPGGRGAATPRPDLPDQPTETNQPATTKENHTMLRIRGHRAAATYPPGRRGRRRSFL